MKEFEIRCEKSVQRRGTAVYLYATDPILRRMYRVSDPVISELPPGLFADPLFTLSDTNAQVLMDDLWRCGFRPTEGAGSAGALAATQAHLEDMRKMNEQMLSKLLTPSVLYCDPPEMRTI